MKKTTKRLTLKIDTVRVLDPNQLARAAGGYTNTCLGTQCQCAPTYGPDCPTVGFTQCICMTRYYSDCNTCYC